MYDTVDHAPAHRGSFSEPEGLASGGRAGAIILALGDAAGDDLLWADLHGEPAVAHTVHPFAASPLVTAIVLVVAVARLTAAQALATHKSWDAVHVVAPPPNLLPSREGETVRASLRDTLMLGLAALPPDCGNVIVHDAARPPVTETILAAGLEAVRATGAATAVMPVRDTIKRVDAAGMVIETPDRAALYTVQTPQVFARKILLAACDAPSPTQAIVDAAQLVELAGGRVGIFPLVPR
jgi:2-C-methyl-D-erythritol 4-phosphate cytidylyltransferase